MPTYDVHAHLVPPQVVADLGRAPRHGVELVTDQEGRSRLRIADRVLTGPLRDDLQDVGQRLSRMDAQGVDVQLLSPFVDTTAYALPSALGSTYASWFNECLAEVVAAHPDRFLGLATVPLQDPQAAAAELRRAIGELGMVGCEIATTVDGQELDVAELSPFWDAAEELGALVLLHPYASLAGRDTTRFFLHNLVGNPAESTIAIAHLILAGTFERHPGLRLCVVHGGGFLPYQLGRLDRGYAAKAGAVAARLTRPPSEWARTLYYDTVTHGPDALALLVDVVGSSQVVLGSDHPFEMGDPDPVATVTAAPRLTPEDRARILGGNVGALVAAVRR